VTGDSPAEDPSLLARVIRYWRVGRRRINYVAEYVVVVVIAIMIFTTILWQWKNMPSRPEVDAWVKSPQWVWTPAESNALARQLADEPLGVTAELFGPGPVPLYRGGSRSPAGPQRRSFNSETENLLRAYQDRLDGRLNGTQSLEYLRDNFVTLRGGTNPDRQFAKDIAYQLALIDLLSGKFTDSRANLAAADCNKSLSVNIGGVDSEANDRSREIRCSWLEGRLALAPDQRRNAQARKAGLDKLRAALEGAIDGVPGDQQVMAGRDMLPGPAGRSRYEMIPSLLSGDYWMLLPEAAGASLWQDYLSALLATKTRLCARRCSDWNDWPAGEPTVDGLQFAKLASQANQNDLWRNYPELAALTRLVLTTNGMVAEARKIGSEQEFGLILVDADKSLDGFQLARSGSNADTVTLHRNYFEFARLAMIVSQGDTRDPATDAREISEASSLWLRHNEARAQWLRGNVSSVQNPFDAGTPAANAFDSLQGQWSQDRPGNVSWWLLAWMAFWAFIAFLGIIFAIRAARALAPSRERHRAELFGSKYFATAQDIVSKRGGGANA